MLRFLITYVILATVGISLLSFFPPVELFEQFCVVLANVCIWVINLFDPGVTLVNTSLVHPDSRFALYVAPECVAFENVWMLWAGILAFRAPWLYKLSGLLVGFLLIQTMNVIRLISLAYIGKWNPDHFTWIHEDLWPLVLSVLGLLLFISWLWLLHQHKAETHEPVAAV